MNEHLEAAAVLAFDEELRLALPAIDAALDAAVRDPGDQGAVKETHRLVHSLKGAASMVGLAALGYLLHQAEELIDAELTSGRPPSPEILTLLRTNLPQLAAYMDAALSGRSFEAIATKVARTFRSMSTGDAGEDVPLLELVAIDARELAALKPPTPIEDPVPAPEDQVPSAFETFVVAAEPPPPEPRTGDADRLFAELASAALATSEPPADAAAFLTPEIAEVREVLESLQESDSFFGEAEAPLPDAAVFPVLDDLVGAFEQAPAPPPPPAAAAAIDVEIELAPAEAIPPELAEVFALEAQEHLQAIARLTGELTTSPDNRDALQELRRAVHTLKGAAGVVGHKAASQLAHRMEDLLDKLYEGQAEMSADAVTVLVASSHALDDLISGEADPTTLRETLKQLFVRFATLVAGAAPAPTVLPGTPVDDLDAMARRAMALAEATRGGDDTDGVPTGEPQDGLTALAYQRQEPASPIADTTAAAASSVEPLIETVVLERRRGQTDRRRSHDDRRGGAQVLRVPLPRMNELVRLMSELVINRSTFDQHYAALIDQVSELKLSTARLRRVAQKLEADYEVRALAGRGMGNGAPLPPLAMSKSAEGFDELEFDRYTEFHLLTRELAETASDINTVSARVTDTMGDFEGDLTRLGRLTHDIQDRVMALKMVTFGTLASRLERAVRVTADSCGKSVDFRIEGDEVALDKSLLEEMADPLLHLLRNGVDHGIETPAARAAARKPERGTIVVRAYHQGTDVVIEVQDDGRGLDVERIRQTAIERGYVGEADADTLTPDALFAFVFEPGFSTANQVSEISGRGVGMDIVKAKVVGLKGRIAIASEPGKGATFSVRVPMTLAITRILLVRAGGEMFGLPLGAIVQILRPYPGAITHVGSERVISVDNRPYPIRDLADTLGLPRSSEPSASAPILITSLGGRLVALAVDEILNSRDAVVKTLGTHLRRVQAVWGATLLGDGTVVLILNPADLAGTVEAPRVRRMPARPTAIEHEPYTVLVVDDSLSMRHVLSTVVKKAGWLPIQARDGVEALEAVHRATRPPDIVLLDIEMPRMDGYEFLATIRAQPAYATLPIVMLTSRGGDKHRDKAKALGATDYMVKPFQEDVLMQTIERLVRTARRSDRRAAS